MPEFWEDSFVKNQEMWGFQPAKSAVLAKNFFVENHIKNILIPGIGYGRNGQVFKENGMQITGIEISKTAIDLAKKHYGNDLTIYHGSVGDMPFGDQTYDGIFCHALIHLLDEHERAKLIQDCYNQLTKNGYMVFTAIMQQAPNFGKGRLISKNRYEFHQGAKLFYYDRETVQAEFGNVGLFEITDVDENQPMFLIKCRKE